VSAQQTSSTHPLTFRTEPSARLPFVATIVVVAIFLGLEVLPNPMLLQADLHITLTTHLMLRRLSWLLGLAVVISQLLGKQTVQQPYLLLWCGLPMALWTAMVQLTHDGTDASMIAAGALTTAVTGTVLIIALHIERTRGLGIGVAVVMAMSFVGHFERYHFVDALMTRTVVVGVGAVCLALVVGLGRMVAPHRFRAQAINPGLGTHIPPAPWSATTPLAFAFVLAPLTDLLVAVPVILLVLACVGHGRRREAMTTFMIALLLIAYVAFGMAAFAVVLVAACAQDIGAMISFRRQHHIAWAGTATVAASSLSALAERGIDTLAYRGQLAGWYGALLFPIELWVPHDQVNQAKAQVS
jgi:hypothetical protein